MCDFGDVLNYRDMTTIIRDRIQDMIKKGMTLEQVKAAKPTLDYDRSTARPPALDHGHVHRSGVQEP